MDQSGHNWIDGRAVPAAAGGWYEIDVDGAPLGRWPRSCARDLAQACAAARAAEAGWRGLGATARRTRLAPAAAALLAQPDPGGAASRVLEFGAAELARHLEDLEEALGDALERALDLDRSALGARDGPCLLAPAWSETWRDPARRVFYALRAGRPVLFVPDPELPMVGDALARALADLPPGVFQVLHDDGRTLLRAARGDGGLASLHPAGERVAGDAPLAADGDPRAPFEERRALRRGVHAVTADVDLAEQAYAVVERCVGRTHALSGSRPGQVGRVLCAARIFARFSAALLAELDRHADVARPLAIARRTQAATLEHAFALGLDEGATAIFTGPLREHRLFPVVFTNVEPRMGLARLARPCALLCLVRIPHGADPRAVLARLDARDRESVS